MNNLRVSNTNSNGRNETAVRVYNNNVLIAEVFPTKRNPLAYIVRYNGKYRKELIKQCVENGVDEIEVLTVLGLVS